MRFARCGSGGFSGLDIDLRTEEDIKTGSEIVASTGGGLLDITEKNMAPKRVRTAKDKMEKTDAATLGGRSVLGA
ncbi:hypothetical protein NDU88_002266 [Pleurodeles waltl]|uniref:Uncharacterized protein n=1 Tax=Pleurodeles waltl TaxID=8319 RepID=A0AAV7UXW5_PLEWA|nr:hypothetical protein NDU88_002266 [Pleurodeles waltl]